MSRRHSAVKRPAMPDPKFGDVVVSKFMSCLMYDGKRSVAEKIVYGAFDRIQERSGNEAVKVFHDALDQSSSLPCLRLCHITKRYSNQPNKMLFPLAQHYMD